MSVFLNQQLSFFKERLYGDFIKPRKFREAFFVDTSSPEMAATVKVKRLTVTGSSTVGATSFNQVEKVGVDLSAEPVTILPFDAAFTINRDDLKTAEMLGMNLETTEIDAANMIIEQDLNSLIWTGIANANKKGFFSLKTQVNVATGSTSSSKLWSAKTGQEMVDDVATAREAISEPFEPNWLYASRGSIDSLKGAQVGTSGKSAYDYIKQNFEMNFLAIPEFATGGTGSTKAFAVLDNSPQYFYIEMPRDKTMRPDLQVDPIAYSGDVNARCGGLVCTNTAAMAIYYGI